MPISGSPEGAPEIHIVHRGAGDTDVQKLLAGRTTSVTWHSDGEFLPSPILFMSDLR